MTKDLEGLAQLPENTRIPLENLFDLMQRVNPATFVEKLSSGNKTNLLEYLSEEADMLDPAEAAAFAKYIERTDMPTLASDMLEILDKLTLNDEEKREMIPQLVSVWGAGGFKATPVKDWSESVFMIDDNRDLLRWLAARGALSTEVIDRYSSLSRELGIELIQTAVATRNAEGEEIKYALPWGDDQLKQVNALTVLQQRDKFEDLSSADILGALLEADLDILAPQAYEHIEDPAEALRIVQTLAGKYGDNATYQQIVRSLEFRTKSQE